MSRSHEGTIARDRQIIRLVAEGCTDREIGERLHYSPRYIHVLIGDICAAHGVKRRAALVFEAVRRGELVP